MVKALPIAELNKTGSNAPLVELADVNEFQAFEGAGATRLRYSYSANRHLDALLVKRDSDTLIVQFHGAVNREKVMLPRFERLATLSSRNVNAMFFADPGLWVDPDITITWYTGWNGVKPQEQMASMIIQAAEQLGVEKVIIVGDSGGGFAALQVSALVSGSICVTFNPTTTIYKYFTSGNSRRTEVQQRFVETMFPETLESNNGVFNVSHDWSEGLSDDISVLKRYSSTTSNYVIFIQNLNDWHYSQHYLPFLAAAAKGNNLSRVRSLEYEGRTGHFSPSQELYLHGITIGEAAAKHIALGERLETLEIPAVDTAMNSSTPKPVIANERKSMEVRKIVLPAGTAKFSNVDDFESSIGINPISSGVYSIGNKTPIIVRWSNKNAPVTLVTFSAALTKNAAPTVPIFSGRRTTSNLEANILMISDPSLILSKELMLGWYAGNSELGEVQSEISRIIKLFRGNSRLVLFGASGGGFAALDQAVRIPGSTALVINPQTDITKYPYFPKYKSLVWAGKFAGATETELPIRTQVVDEYSKPVESSVIYVQNTEDEHHYVDQMRPFRENLHDDNTVIFVERDLGQGHFGPDAESMTRLFELATSVSEPDELRARLEELELVSVKPN